jgi:alginate O-acetyltransferase complex protein AlgI
MSVLSLTWLGWMAMAVTSYWVLPARWRDLGLAALTLAFLSYYSAASAVIVVAFTMGTYYLAGTDAVSARRAIAAGAAIVAVLGFYKYQVSVGGEDFFRQVVMPLGLSYYALRCLHYIIEKYKGALPDHDFPQFVCYLLFLPTIAAGPIHRFAPFHKDLRRKRWNNTAFSEGLERILYGYVKITVLANYLVSVIFKQFIEGTDQSNQALVAYLDILRHSLNLYFQFSGYSDVAIGFALLLGYRVMENFNWPFFKTNISDFWRAWHISLSSWCREYVYGLIISITRSPAMAVVSAMVALGLWHELSLRYIVWGFYHGAGIAVWQAFQHVKPSLPRIRNRYLVAASQGLSALLTFHFVIFGFTIVKEPDLILAFHELRTVLLFWW